MDNQELRYSKSHWEDMEEDEINDFVLDIFRHYRKNGFPYYSLTIDEQRKEMEKMNLYMENNLILDHSNLKQTMHCLNVAWTYFPHAFNVKCGSYMTPLEAFDSDEKFKRVIRKRLKRGTYITDSGIRKALKSTSGIQAVSNFRPTSARAIYHKYAGSGTVWDMSCGYGGRLLGAISSPKVKHYIGTEPDKRTYNGLLTMARNLGNGTDVEIHNIGSEDFIPEKESLDLCFTSPPYFNTEKYDNAPTQSYIKFPKKEDWLNEFLMKTIQNCVYGLKDGGYLIINVANVKTYSNLTEDFVYKMNRRFPFMMADGLLQYSLSAIQTGGMKTEPIFVFKKTYN